MGISQSSRPVEVAVTKLARARDACPTSWLGVRPLRHGQSQFGRHLASAVLTNRERAFRNRRSGAGTQWLVGGRRRQIGKICSSHVGPSQIQRTTAATRSTNPMSNIGIPALSSHRATIRSSGSRPMLHMAAPIRRDRPNAIKKSANLNNGTKCSLWPNPLGCRGDRPRHPSRAPRVLGNGDRVT
jgi:hypothetical protein